MKHGSLFTGIGGFDLAAQWMGWETLFQVEIDKQCNKVLEKNFSNVKRFRDAKEFDGSTYRGAVDIVSGGWPCPKYSKAGKQTGGEPLKAELIRITKQINPPWFVFENVPGLITPKLSVEHSDLINEMESCGYQTGTFCISADMVGANQIRERVWIIGHKEMANHSDTPRGELGEIFNQGQKEGPQNRIKLPGNTIRLHWYEAISRIHRILNGLSRGMDGHRNRMLGNAVYPEIPYLIFKSISTLNPAA